MEKQTVFIKRYPSKGELPKENVWLDTNIGYVKFDTSDSRWLAIGGIVEWWLEEIELPSEKDVKAELTHPVNISENVSTLLRDMYEHGIDRAYNFILNKLKGETK